jgi:hypothetical protein
LCDKRTVESLVDTSGSVGQLIKFYGERIGAGGVGSSRISADSVTSAIKFIVVHHPDKPYFNH